MSAKVYKTLECRDGERRYVAEELRAPRDSDAHREVHVTELSEGQRARLPMRLTILSRLRHPTCYWPPESVEAVHCNAGVLAIEFRDPWFPYEKRVIGQECLWRATYDRGRGRWRLSLVRKLDYENGDMPP